MLDSSPEDEDFPGRLLHQAALWDNRELLEDLLNGGQLPYINSKDSWGRTPLHAAAINEHSHCLQLLLDAGADPNIQCGPRGEKKVPLHLSAEYGHIHNVELLLQNNADILARDINGFTASDLADKAGHKDCSNILKGLSDAKEQVKLGLFSSIRDACSQKNVFLVEKIISSLGNDAEVVLNMAPKEGNTVLFMACEQGNTELVRLLVLNGASGRLHPATKYSPLHIASYHGHYAVMEILLQQFPELVQQHTVEGWLPIHGCCINGHVKVLELLLNFPYPQHILKKFRDVTGQWQYFMPFDINDRDSTGRTILYIASCTSKALVDVILKFRVEAVRIEAESNLTPSGNSHNINLTKRKVSRGIQAIMAKLNLSKENSVENVIDVNPNVSVMSPVIIDMYCNNNTETSLHVAVKGKHYEIVYALLNGGADSNAVIKPFLDINETLSCCAVEEDSLYGQSTALVEACRNKDCAMAELLLSFGARDDLCKALAIAIENQDELLTTKLLSLKAYPDAEYKINKKCMTENIHTSHFSKFTNVASLTYSTLFPNISIMINWHNQRCHLQQIQKQWLIDASLNINQKLKLNPRSSEIALYAITRLDVSTNSLTSVPICVFQLCSLRYLNLAQNKIEKLPEPLTSFNNEHSEESLSAEGCSNYMCPVLEELYLQYNRLEGMPGAIFHMPSLTILDVSNNKLQSLPYDMWSAPKLVELNASFNLLKELPTIEITEESKGITEKLDVNNSSNNSQDLIGFSDLTVDSASSDAEEFESNHPNIKYRRKIRSFTPVEMIKQHIWNRNVEVTEEIIYADEYADSKSSQLSSLNIAHNLFTSIPAVLPCLAVNLTRLNMAFNLLRSMSHITSFPSSLKQLDLSHNKISCWPSLPQVETQDIMEIAHLSCYCKSGKEKEQYVLRRNSDRSIRNIILHSVCSHRRHLRLDNLRSLVLANNKLIRIQLTTDGDGNHFRNSDENDGEKRNYLLAKEKLIFPNLSMLDVSNNNLKEIPSNIYELSGLSVLNISGNSGINELPPQMGLLSRLWSLNTNGCSLQEPLKSMIDSGQYKTMDIIGYLKSVLEDARLYARMKLMIVGIKGIGKTSLLEELRLEGSVKKRPEHWAKRIGNKNINIKTSKGENMSTVGVDIGDWIYEKKIRNQSTHGPVVFRTWDFGGQKEYYATHQYFLSKRSLYLVVWKIADGLKGLNEISQWLVNIQARAPNSPVIIVGTHFDMMQEKQCNNSEEYQQIIRERFINVMDSEKYGLPRVLDTIEVSCRTRHNIKLLCNLIYDTVFSLKSPGSKELLLEQKVPATYLALEDVVNYIAAERKQTDLDPVLSSEQYQSLVAFEMQKRYGKSFRDLSELHQATLFLHDNGVLLHYEDATLKDLYFLDPQWLCDMLAHVVTIREINPFAQSGIMKLEDLQQIFKACNIRCMDSKECIVNLLNKFEVALTWDSRTLLIPSLLPTEEDVQKSQVQGAKVKVPLRSRGRDSRNRSIMVSPKSLLYKECEEKCTSDFSSFNQQNVQYEVTGILSDTPITRFVLMSYFPSGFWSRLLCRMLADDSVIDIIRSFFTLPKQVIQNPHLVKLLNITSDWVLWQTGLQLVYGDIVLFKMGELQNVPTQFNAHRLRLKQEGTWCNVDLETTSILEICFPIKSVNIKNKEKDAVNIDSAFRNKIIMCCPESTAKLLSLAVDHIDILLEDWYPTLGTRFVHTSEGKFLVTRLVPCPTCLQICRSKNCLTQQDNNECSEAVGLDIGIKRMPKSRDSYSSEIDSGMETDSTESSRISSTENHPGIKQKVSGDLCLYTWTIEDCILAAYSARCLSCPKHYDINLTQIAPDTVFLDVGDRNLIKPDQIKRGRLLGRGAFGFVFKGSYKIRGSSSLVHIAMKMLQPVPPGPNTGQSALIAYKAAQSKWDRDPLQYACKAYCTARQELNILLSLKHPNIVALVGICISPLALILELAPQGALDLVLKHYRRSGAKLEPLVLQNVVLQVAKAIEYLHRQRIIYRDLKSENVLVWEIPPPYSGNLFHTVHVKLADYGISRSTLPSGAKGFGGTEGFMAPEIIQYNGEEEYTDKVDCFSFGMFIYELMSLHQPFEGHESVKECILEGGRPSLTYRETSYPCYCLDLMAMCWNQCPKDRPSASQIVSIASAPEFTHLNDVISVTRQLEINASTIVPVTHITDDGLSGYELWLSGESSRIDLLLVAGSSWVQHYTLSLQFFPTAISSVGNMVWIGDQNGIIHAYMAEDGHQIFSYALERECKNAVTGLVYVSALKRVACSLSNKRLFLLNSEIMPCTSTTAEGTFVMTELCSQSVSCCLCAVIIESERKYELWSGQSLGQISIHIFNENSVTGQELINHPQSLVDAGEVTNLIATGNTVYSYVKPGCVIYQWDQKSRCIINKLDCSKLIPCSESLKSIAIEEHLSPTNCQVTSLATMNDELYIGTAWGCIIIAQCSTLRPITVFRPYEADVKAIIPLILLKTPPSVVTIGRGYRNLLTRYTDINLFVKNTCKGNRSCSNNTNPFALIWRAENWNTN